MPAVLILRTRFTPEARINLETGAAAPAEGGSQAGVDVALDVLQPYARLEGGPLTLAVAPRGDPGKQWIAWAAAAAAAAVLVVVLAVKALRR